MSQPSNLVDRIRSIITFKSEKEMDEWLANKVGLQELKKQYPPRFHHCYFNKPALLVIIVRRENA